MHVLELALELIGNAGECLVVRDEEGQTAEIADRVVENSLCDCDSVMRASLCEGPGSAFYVNDP